uniref:Uncharacterized protein n=1 Tax=Arundo donax TaxID=35708 RepID=A0A0A8ZAD2_ARUDO
MYSEDPVIILVWYSTERLVSEANTQTVVDRGTKIQLDAHKTQVDLRIFKDMSSTKDPYLVLDCHDAI